MMGCWKGQADTEHALLGVAQTLLVPTGFSWELDWGSGLSRDWYAFLEHLLLGLKVSPQAG